MQTVRGVQTQDGCGHMSTGTSGDLLLFCNNCRDTRDPIATINNTSEGPVVSCGSRRHHSGSWSSPKSVKVTCGRCGNVVRVTFEELIPLLERLTVKATGPAPCQARQGQPVTV